MACVASANDARRSRRARIKARFRRSELRQEWRRRPEVRSEAILKSHNGVVDIRYADLIGVKHRSATPRGKSVAVQPDDVDVDRSRRDSLAQNLRAFVDHAVETALDDLLVADRTALDAGLSRMLDDHLLDHGIGDRRAAAFFVAVPACAGLLPEAAQLANLVEQVAVADAGLAQMRPRLAIAPADVEAREIAHGERTHREAEIGQNLVHLLRQRTFLQQEE